MRVGGEVVALSKRFEVLGEEDPGGEPSAGAAPVMEDPTAPSLQPMRDATGLRPVPIPDTVGAGGRPPVPDTVGIAGPGEAPKPPY